MVIFMVIVMVSSVFSFIWQQHFAFGGNVEDFDLFKRLHVKLSVVYFNQQMSAMHAFRMSKSSFLILNIFSRHQRNK